MATFPRQGPALDQAPWGGGVVQLDTLPGARVVGDARCRAGSSWALCPGVGGGGQVGAVPWSGGRAGERSVPEGEGRGEPGAVPGGRGWGAGAGLWAQSPSPRAWPGSHICAPGHLPAVHSDVLL